MEFEIHSRKFQQKLRELGSSGCDEIAQNALNDTVKRALRMVRNRTPVGVKPKIDGPKTEKVKSARGKTRSFLTKDGAMLKQYWSGYKGGTLRKGWSANPAVKRGTEWRAAIYNPLEYAAYVEHGHRQTPGRYVPAIGKRLKRSWVPGQHMLRDSLTGIESEFGEIVRKSMRKTIKERFE